MEILAIVASIVASIVSGMALFFMKRYFNGKDKRDAERDRAKAEQSILILKAINSVGKLTEANSIALRDGHTNGEMREAMEKYSLIEEELYEYLLKQNARK